MTNGKFIEGGRTLLIERLQQAVRTATPETVQAFVDLLADVVEGRKTPIEMRDALSRPGDLQSLFQELSQQGSVPNPGGGAPLLDLHGQINFGSQIVQDLVAGNQVKISITINNADGSTEIISSDPPRRIIYISHCAKDDKAKALLDAIDDKLRDEGFVVYKNEARLVGRDWDYELFDQIGRCQGAIILLSRDALQSELVAAEAALLLSRPTIDDPYSYYPYVLCKVYAADVTDTELDGSLLGNLPWHSVSTVSALSVDAAAAEVVTKMRRLPEEVFEAPLTALEQRIADRLSASARELRTAIRVLDSALPTALQVSDLRVKLAQALLHSKLDTAFAAFDLLGRANVPRDAIAQIFRLTATAWVDPRSATWVALATRRTQKQRALGLNTGHADTAKLCVWRACHLRPNALPMPPNPGSGPISSATPYPYDGWDPVEVTNAGGGLSAQAEAEALVTEVTDRLRTALREDRASDVPNALNALEENGKPVLVVIPSENNSITPEALAALQHAFPTVTFLLLLGGQLPSPEAWPLKPTPLICPPLKDDSKMIKDYQFGVRSYAPFR